MLQLVKTHERPGISERPGSAGCGSSIARAGFEGDTSTCQILNGSSALDLIPETRGPIPEADLASERARNVIAPNVDRTRAPPADAPVRLKAPHPCRCSELKARVDDHG